MKKIYLLIFAIVSAFYGIGQIPNAGFENWTDGNPNGWNTSNNPPYTPVVQVTNAHSGSSAMKMQWQSNGMIGANVTCPDNSNPGIFKFPYVGRPESLSGWYISSFGANDYLRVFCDLYKGGVVVGTLTKEIHGSSATYSQFVLPITYMASGNADSASIQMTLLYGSSADYSSFVLVDDLAFNTNLTGLAEPDKNKSAAVKSYLDPASGKIHIEYQFDISGPVNLFIRDLNGKIVKILVNQDQEAGRYTMDINLDSFQEGLYLVEFESVQGLRSQKICVMGD